MDLEELKILSQTNAETIAPFKKIIYSLACILFLTIGLFGYCFITFMYKAFETSPGDQNISAYEIDSSTLTQTIGK